MKIEQSNIVTDAKFGSKCIENSDIFKMLREETSTLHKRMEENLNTKLLLGQLAEVAFEDFSINMYPHLFHLESIYNQHYAILHKEDKLPSFFERTGKVPLEKEMLELGIQTRGDLVTLDYSNDISAFFALSYVLEGSSHGARFLAGVWSKLGKHSFLSKRHYYNHLIKSSLHRSQQIKDHVQNSCTDFRIKNEIVNQAKIIFKWLAQTSPTKKHL